MVGEKPVCILTADIDNDDDIDILTANENSSNISILFNEGDRISSEVISLPMANYPNSITVADLDGDGYLDLVSACRISSNMSILLNNGNGDFIYDSC